MAEPFSNAGPTFCVYPWIEQVVQSNGNYSYCCVAQKGGPVQRPDGKSFNASDDRLEDVWNSESMRSLRKAMLDGAPVKDCKLCYFQESIGKKSYRQMHNQEWEEKAKTTIEDRLEYSKKNDYAVDGKPLYLDLRLGNLCNLKCRSCNPNNSSPIFKETEELLATNSEFKDLWQRHGHGTPKLQKNWYETEEFWDQIISSIPNLRKVYLTGGEPTLIQGNYRFLQACIDSGYSKNIFLMFNVNGTNLPPRLLELLPHFEFVLMNVSIDGFASDNDYIRFPSQWEKISRNLQTLLKTPGPIQVGVTPVIQVYNILGLNRLLQFVQETSVQFDKLINVDFLYATSPKYLDPQILPASIKREARLRLENYRDRSKTYGVETYLKNSVDSCIRMLQQSEGQVDAEQIQDFLRYTAILDQKRHQSFANQFKELSAMFRAEGFPV